MKVFALRWGAVLLLGASQCALADTTLSLLTINGEVHPVSGAINSELQRIGLAEYGRAIIVDEFAVLYSGPKSPVVSFASEGFPLAAYQLTALVPAIGLTATELNLGGASETLTAGQPKNAARVLQTPQNLLIQHQRVHPPNHYFVPTPTAEFVPQPVIADEVEGQRGFAIVDLGESGQVLRIKILSRDGLLRNRELQTAIANGLKTNFQDERRHDHTVYLAYEVRDQTISQVGTSLVTLPMCNGPPPCS